VYAVNNSGLEVHDVSVAYGSRAVVRGASFSIRHGEILAVVGLNGSGKSSLLKGIAGLKSTRSGTVHLNGKDLTAAAAHERSRFGLRVLLQGQEIFPSLRISENLSLSRRALGGSGVGEPAAGSTLLDIPSSRFEDLAGTLSGGERKLLGLEMVFIGKPGCLLLDEPTAGLTPALVDRVLDRVALFARTEGVPVLLIEQNVRAALRIAHRGFLMRQGIGSEVEVEEVARNPRLLLLGPGNGPIVAVNQDH